MCYADTATNDDGTTTTTTTTTTTAFCRCGRSADHATPETADADAERHQTADAAESLFVA